MGIEDSYCGQLAYSDLYSNMHVQYVDTNEHYSRGLRPEESVHCTGSIPRFAGERLEGRRRLSRGGRYIEGGGTDKTTAKKAEDLLFLLRHYVSIIFL